MGRPFLLAKKEFERYLKAGKANTFGYMPEIKTYSQFLNSPTWKAIRNNYLTKYGGKCFFCDSTARINVHHINYRHMFFYSGYKTYYNSLLALCSKCHNNIHRMRMGYRAKKRTYIRLKKRFLELNNDWDLFLKEQKAWRHTYPRLKKNYAGLFTWKTHKSDRSLPILVPPG